MEKTKSSTEQGFEEPAALLILNHMVEDSWQNLLLLDLLMKVSDDEGLGFIRTPGRRILRAVIPEAGEDLQVFDRLCERHLRKGL